MKKYKRCYIEITNVCNANCSFCDKHTRVNGYLTLPQFNNIVSQVQPLVDEVYFHLMGEPLIHPLLNEFLTVCDGVGLHVKITTNAKLLFDKLEMLKPHSCLKQVNISLHSFLQCDYNDKNITELFDAVKELKRNKIVSVLRVWNGDNNGYQLSLIERFYDVKLETPQNIKTQTNVKIDNYTFVSFDNQFDWPGLTKQSGKTTNTNCYGAKTHFGVLCDGTVVPCCLDNNGVIALGNLNEKPLVDILQSSRAKALVEGFNKGVCTEELCEKCGFRQNHF